jgi:alkylation response protein AidB-like acyl-CoA dehydrogenase
MWITNSAEAELFLVFATVDPSKGYKGITCFLVEKEMGVEIAKKEQKVRVPSSPRGMHTNTHTDMFFSLVFALLPPALSTLTMSECLLQMLLARSAKVTRSLLRS